MATNIDIGERLAVLADHLAAVRTDVAQLTRSQAKLEHSHGVLATRVDALDRRIGDLSEHLGHRIDDLGVRLDHRIDDSEKRFDHFRHGQNMYMAAIGMVVAALVAWSFYVHSRIDSLAGDVAALAATQAVIVDDLGELDLKVDAIAEQLAALTEMLAQERAEASASR